jgi:hypothetical protein
MWVGNSASGKNLVKKGLIYEISQQAKTTILIPVLPPQRRHIFHVEISL